MQFLIDKRIVATVAALGWALVAGTALAQQSGSFSSGPDANGNSVDGAWTTETPNNWGLHVPPSNQPQDNWPQIIGDSIMKGLNQGQQNQGWFNNNGNRPNWSNRPQKQQYYYDDDDGYNNRPAPRPQAAPRPKAVVKKNAPPKAKPKLALAKKNPVIQVQPAGASLVDSVGEQIDAAEAKKLDDLKTQLDKIDPEIMDFPTVKEAYAELKTKLASGQTLTDADFKKFNDSTALVSQFRLNLDQKAQLADAILQTTGGVLAMQSLKQQLQPGTIGINFILYNPVLQPGYVVLLPSGAIMTGGGGYDTLTLQQGPPAQALGLPVMDAPAWPEATAADSLATSGVVITNPTESECSYVLNDQFNYTMKPGESQTLPADQIWVIKFDRGGTAAGASGEAQYTLTEGHYAFGTKNDGWELLLLSHEVVIDNHDNPNSFEYVLDNMNYVVDARGTRKHSSRFPIHISFDRGGDGQPATKTVSDQKATLRVAVDKNDQLWNMYPVEPNEAITTAGE